MGRLDVSGIRRLNASSNASAMAPRDMTVVFIPPLPEQGWHVPIAPYRQARMMPFRRNDWVDFHPRRTCAIAGFRIGAESANLDSKRRSVWSTVCGYEDSCCRLAPVCTDSIGARSGMDRCEGLEIRAN